MSALTFGFAPPISQPAYVTSMRKLQEVAASQHVQAHGGWRLIFREPWRCLTEGGVDLERRRHGERSNLVTEDCVHVSCNTAWHGLQRQLVCCEA
eukprot:SAG11_NODE_1486_length_4819_cov_1.894280_5_plen_95_part_00